MSKSFSVMDMTRNSSKDLLDLLPGEETFQKESRVKLDKINVDFGNIINEN